MAENKVQFNLLNVHYATINDDGSYSAPVHVPGAVNLSLDAQGEITPFYADGIVYYQTVANNGYSGSLEMARLTDVMKSDIWGMTTDANGVMTENSTVEPKSFALLFQIDGDAESEYYCLYNCSASRPSIASSTNTETKEPVTQTMELSAVPKATGEVFARTTATTEAATKESWFNAVYTGATESPETPDDGGEG